MRTTAKTIGMLALLPIGWQAGAQEPPTVPVGTDAYKYWERWPYQRIGVRAYMRSTYDRTGGNETADASHFLYQLADDNNVTLDVMGAGVLCFARYNHWHGSPWRYRVDGQEYIVSESSTADPNHPVHNSVFLPQAAFPSPLALTYNQTQGADLSWVPIAFTNAFRMGYSRSHYGTGYYIYQQFVPGIPLSQPLVAWNPNVVPDSAALTLLNRAGTDIAPQPGTPEGDKAGVQAFSGMVTLPANSATTLGPLPAGAQMIRAIEFSVPIGEALAFGKARLQATWDGRALPSIDAPIALFYGAGTLYNRNSQTYLVKALPVHIQFDTQRVTLACYFPMPYFQSATLSLVNPGGTALTDVRWSARTVPYTDPANQVGYFHATYHDFPTPEAGHDLVLLDTQQTEGGGDWSGHLAGMTWTFSHNANLSTLEGDPRFFFDDSQTPQAQGTGTEEWGGGGDYWGGNTTTLPLAGHPVGAPSLKTAQNDEDKIESAYRFLLADLMPFGRNARIGLEHGGTDESTEHYETVTYWYGAPYATLLPTDSLHVGVPASEHAHAYIASHISAPYSLTSRYEWGVDHLNGVEIFPAQTDVGRLLNGTSEFTLAIDPRNVGVMLRRKLDYAYPNQRANVYVLTQPSGAPKPTWSFAGVWYLAGSNTCVFSNPALELGAPVHVKETSNRRFRDDEFLLPRTLTAGKSSLRLRVDFRPVAVPLFPGDAVPPLAWSEMRYDVYSYVLPPPP